MFAPEIRLKDAWLTIGYRFSPDLGQFSFDRRNQELLERGWQQFVQLKPLAVVQCKSATPAPVSASIAFAAACAVSTGIRWIVLAPDALPPPDEIRQRVLGA